MTTTIADTKPITGSVQPAPVLPHGEPATVISVSHGKGKKGDPSDPVQYDSVMAFALDIEARLTVDRPPVDISKDEYKARKDRGPWVMRAIDEATAYDDEKKQWHRRKGSVTFCDFLLFDADKMRWGSYARVRKYLKESGVAFLMYQTTGHELQIKGGGECFRVFIPCQNIPAEIAVAVNAWIREQFTELFPGDWDETADQSTRVMYLPPKDARVDCSEGNAPALDALNLFTREGLTLVKTNASGIERGEADVGAYGDFIDHLITQYGGELVHKPDGRVGVQMSSPRTVPNYSTERAPDKWAFWLPSGGFDMMTFTTLHGNGDADLGHDTKPGQYDIVKAVNAVATECDDKAIAGLYATASRAASVASLAYSAPEYVSDEALVGKAPAGLNVPLIEFTLPPSLEWPEDLIGEPPAEPQRADFETEADFDKAVAKYAKDSKAWDDTCQQVRIERHQHYNERYIYVARGKLVVDRTLRPSVRPLTLDEFATAKSPEKYPAPTQRDKLAAKSYASAWIQSTGRRTVHDTGYQPGAPRVYFDEHDGIEKVNTFFIEPFEYTEEETRLKDFFWLVQRTHPDAHEADLFYHWLAVTFRYPTLKIPFAHVNISPAYGSGRGRLIKIVSALLGAHNVGITTPADVSEDKYHDYMFRKLVTFIEEGDEDASGKRIKISGVWNNAITAERQMLNLKYGGKVEENIYNNVFMALNDYSLSISAGDRRVQATTGAPADIEDPGPVVWGRVDALARDKAFRDQLASWLWRRDLSAFDYRAPDKTLPARARLLMNSGSFEEQLARELLEDLPCAVVPSAWLKALVSKACVKQVNNSLNQNQVLRAVNKAAAFEKVVDYSPEFKNVKCRIFDAKMKRGYADELRKHFEPTASGNLEIRKPTGSGRS